MKQSGKITGMIAFLMALWIPSFLWAADEIVIPEGTRITLQLNDNLSTKRNKEGDGFKALVVNSISLEENIVIPKGSVVAGSISRIIRPGRFKGKPVMNLLFQSISIPGRGEYPIEAMLEQLNSEDSEEHPEGTVKGKGSAGRDVGTVLAPSLIGAGIGGVAGGGKGAGIGAGIGAVIGIATIISTPGNDLELSRGITLNISLEKPLIIPAESENISARFQ